MSIKALPLVNNYDYRAICLFFACIVYGLFGSPTPNHYGFAEYLVAVLLMLSIGIGRFRDALFQPLNRDPEKKRFWKSAGQAYLLYGFSVPFIIGLSQGATFGQMVRDFIPFLFLFLTLFLLPLIRARPHYYRAALFGVLCIGFLFSVRSLVNYLVTDCPLWCGSAELYYFENMPTVLFCALLCIGVAMQNLFKSLSVRNYILCAGLLVLSVFPVTAMALTLQRASLGSVLLYMILIFGFFCYKSPARAANIALVFLIVMCALQLFFFDAFGALFVKTQKVGLNMRPQEFAAVWDVVTSDPISFLFGKGWGAQFHSPAVGGLSVNYTHNFFTSVLLKTGLLGIILALLYVVGLLERLARVIIHHPVIGIALAAPILIDLTLYASFKSLDFGLILLMTSASLVFLRHKRGAPDVVNVSAEQFYAQKA